MMTTTHGTMDIEERMELAERVAAALSSTEGLGRADRRYTARASDAGGEVRVYVRDSDRRDIGYVEVLGDGRRNYNPIQRGKASVRDRAEAALK